MITSTEQLIRVIRENRDTNLETARTMQERGARPELIRTYVHKARGWNHELIRLAKESRH